jgi:hypothetical protein
MAANKTSAARDQNSVTSDTHSNPSLPLYVGLYTSITTCESKHFIGENALLNEFLGRKFCIANLARYAAKIRVNDELKTNPAQYLSFG